MIRFIINQREFKVKRGKVQKVRENADDHIEIGFCFASDWLRGWRVFSGSITDQSKSKLKQCWIAFDNQIKITLELRVLRNKMQLACVLPKKCFLLIRQLTLWTSKNLCKAKEFSLSRSYKSKTVFLYVFIVSQQAGSKTQYAL